MTLSSLDKKLWLWLGAIGCGVDGEVVFLVWSVSDQGGVCSLPGSQRWPRCSPGVVVVVLLLDRSVAVGAKCA